MPPLAALLRIALLSLIVLAGLSAAPASAAGPHEEVLEMAREEAGSPAPPQSGFALPAGRLEIHPAETVAAQPGQRLRFSVILNRAVTGGRLRLELPKVWTERAASGLRYAKPARLASGAARSAALSRDGRTIDLTLRDADAGDAAAIEIVDIGIPARYYRIPWSYTDAAGREVADGTATVRFYAPTREGEENPNPWTKLEAPSMVESNATEQGDECEFVDCQATQGGAEEQSETYIGVSPYDSDRILVQSNNTDDGTEGAFFSTDGGKTYKRLRIPNEFDAPGETEPEIGDYCCDPMSAEDNLGNIWFGGLTSGVDENAPSRIVVNRIAAGTDEFQPLTVGLPLLADQEPDAGQQDKNLMTIDNSPTSPTYGRLYVVWNDTGDGNQVIVSHCDTRPGGFSNAAHCDEADNWSVPVPVSEAGSVIYADAAVGPDGKLYVTWWDFSSRNAIVGRVCDPTGAANCDKPNEFGELQEIAILNNDLSGLDDDAGEPLPFACPIPAQPGGRPGPSPGVEVDISNGPNRGRVYVSWGDLRPGSGVRRCERAVVPGTPPSPEILTWDSFVASAPDGRLPGEAKPSVDVATRLYTDADVQEAEGQEPDVDDQGNAAAGGNSDEWFPWFVVDQQTGRAYGDFYSTRDDASVSRRTTHFYTREVIPDASAPGGHRLGVLTRSSTQPSDYSTGTTGCCVFGNDYGDYTGLDSAEGYVFPVWTRRAGAGDDGDAYTVVPEGPNPQLVLHELKVGEGAAGVANGNGQIEPGEGIRVFLTVKNPSEVGVTKVAGTFVSPTSKATVTRAPSGYPDIAPGGGLGTNVVAFEARLARDIPCGASGPTPVDFRVDLTTAEGPESVAFLVPVCAKASAPGVEPGGNQPGGNQPGGDQPGGDQPGTKPPGGDQPGTTSCQRSGGLKSVSVSGRGRGVRLGFERRTEEPVTIDVFRVSKGRRVIKERLVARFSNRTSGLTWNGRSNRGDGKRKKVGSGYYFVRYTMRRNGRRIDARRLVLRRSGGRFARRPDFFRRDTCDLLGRFKLERPVFGGPRAVTLKGAYELNEAARVTVTILRGSRVVRRYATAQREAGRTYRFTLPATKRPRGEYRVRLQAVGAKKSITTSLVSRRL